MIPTQHYAGGAERRDVPTVKGTAALLGVFMGFLLLLSYPLAMVMLGTAIAVSLLASKYALPEVVTRVRNETRRLTLPGIGTIEYRLTDR